MDELERYYNERAGALDEISATYLHPSAYKRWFFTTRFTAVFGVLDPKPNEKILEIGCGSGYYTKAIAQITPHLTASEYAEKYLAAARSYNTVPIDGYVHCSATELPFEDASFDKVLITEVIEHIPDWKKALDEIARVLKPGGTLVISTPNRLSYMNRAYAVKRKAKKFKFNEHVIEFSPNEFKLVISERLAVRSMFFVNFLLPHPFDIRWTNHSPSQRVVRMLDAIERWMQRSFLSHLGWTMIITATKKPASDS